MNDKELDDLLRRGDPAAGLSPIDAAERAVLRHTIVARAETSATGRYFAATGGRFLGALAAVAVLVVMVGTAWLLRTAAPAAVDAPVAAVGTPSLPALPLDRDVAADAVPATDVTPTVVAMPQPAAGPTTAPVAASAKRGGDRAVRTLRFTAPRGTRIIWTLDPEFESPTTEPSARQEHGK